MARSYALLSTGWLPALCGKKTMQPIMIAAMTADAIGRAAEPFVARTRHWWWQLCLSLWQSLQPTGAKVARLPEAHRSSA